MWHNSYSHACQEGQGGGGKHWGQQSSVVKAWTSGQPLYRAQVCCPSPCMCVTIATSKSCQVLRWSYGGMEVLQWHCTHYACLQCEGLKSSQTHPVVCCTGSSRYLHVWRLHVHACTPAACSISNDHFSAGTSNADTAIKCHQTSCQACGIHGKMARADYDADLVALQGT